MSAIAVVRNARDLLDEAGLHGAFLVRDLDTGAEIGFDADTPYPAASLVKVPLAVAVGERIARGELDPAMPVDVAPGWNHHPGPDRGESLPSPRADRRGGPALPEHVRRATGSPPTPCSTSPRRPSSPPSCGGSASTASPSDNGSATSPTRGRTFGPDDVHLAHSLAIGAATPGQGHPSPNSTSPAPTPGRPGPSSTCCTPSGDPRRSTRAPPHGYAP